MTVNKVRLWAPKATALSYPTSLSLSLSLSLSSSSLSVLLQRKKLILTDHSHAQRSFCFLPIQCSFCSFFFVLFVLLPPVTHKPTHTNPSREIISVDLRSHAKKLHHVLVLSSLLSYSFFDLAGASKSASTATTDLCWKRVEMIQSGSFVVDVENSFVGSLFLIWKLIFYLFFIFYYFVVYHK